MKRLFDIIFSCIFLVITFPFLLIVSIAIKLDTKGPVFFVSSRIGLNNDEFKMLKFRTMLIGTELVATNKIKNANKKITTVGEILRRYSIDEIPQFLSVINGKMSIVGPRPVLPSQKDLIISRTKLQINVIKPGITGLAQIKGRDKITASQKLSFDLEYLRNYSFINDLKIIFKTAIVVLQKKIFLIKYIKYKI